jgi:ribosomal protein S18 acetylase RimI-like enzyme
MSYTGSIQPSLSRGGSKDGVLSSEILDIREIDPRAYAPLLEAEARAWLENLHWDYTPSAKLISSCLAERRLSGFALVVNHCPKGYCFFFIEGGKGLIGDLFLDPSGTVHPQALQLLERSISALVGTEGVHRVEAQLPHFSLEQLETCFRSHSFQAFLRQFMAVPLGANFAPVTPLSTPQISEQGLTPNEEFQLEPWTRKHDREAARLIYDTYRHHVDALLNDQYSSLEGAARLVDNIVHLQGCGEFLTRPSCAAVHVPSRKLAGILALTRVRSGTAHIPQIAVSAQYQGIGLGTTMLKNAFCELARCGYSELSLTVTALNSGAVRLYERLGFRTFRTFGAFVWRRS